MSFKENAGETRRFFMGTPIALTAEGIFSYNAVTGLPASDPEAEIE